MGTNMEEYKNMMDMERKRILNEAADRLLRKHPLSSDFHFGYTRKEAEKEIQDILSGKSVLLYEDCVDGHGQPRFVTDVERIEQIKRSIID